MNSFDYVVLRWLTAYANRWPWFDAAVAFVVPWEIAKGGVTMALYWWQWFHPDPRQPERRQTLVLALAGALVALVLASSAAMVLPFRPRPRLAVGMDPRLSPGWHEWSAFPSDHATLFFALAMGLWRISRAWGTLALAHALFWISLPRVYLGLHYPTDILGGVAIALLVTAGWWRRPWAWRQAAALVRLAERCPAGFYAVAFVLTYSMATLFGDWRRAATTLLRWLWPTL